MFVDDDRQLNLDIVNPGGHNSVGGAGVEDQPEFRDEPQLENRSPSSNPGP